MDLSVNCRFFLGFLVVTAASCSSNPPTPTTDLGEQTKGETSWHCEENAGAWSCKRRTIGEIHERQAATDARKFDWSQAESPEENPSRWSEGSATRPATAQDAYAETRPEDSAETGSRPDAQIEARPATSSTLNSQAQPSPTPGLAELEPTGYQRLMYRPDRPMSLEDLPSSYWTVQLIALSSARELQGFMSTLQMDGLTGAMIKTNDRIFYVALLGVYETRAAAQLAAKERPESLSRYQPYVRSLGSLQAAMARAEQLPR